MEGKYSQSFENIETKIHRFKEELLVQEGQYVKRIQDEKKDRADGLSKEFETQYKDLKQEAGLLFKLKENTNQNINLIQRMYDYKDKGQREAEH